MNDINDIVNDIMNNIMNDKKSHNIVNDKQLCARKPDELLVN